MPDGATSRILIPVVAVLALAAAGGVWLAPLKFLEPSSITGAEKGAPPFPPFERAKPANGNKPAEAVKKDWLALAEPLDKLREHQAVVENVNPPGPEPENQSKPTIELHWQYVGFAGTPDHPAAFVSTSAMQRVIFPNDMIVDPEDPTGTPIRIKHIDQQKLIIEHQGKEQTFEIAKFENDLTRASAASSNNKPAGAPPRPIVGGIPGISTSRPEGTPTPQPGTGNTPGVRAR